MLGKYPKEEAIAIVKEIMSREFSDEQVEIITHYGKPLNGIAGAGSGKTTVSIGKIFYLMLNKEVSPEEILSITYSKKASVEIEERYHASKNKLNRSLGSPLFKTFHAFFLALLKGTSLYRDIQICSYTDFYYDLLTLVESNSAKTEKDALEQYMRVRGVLVNYNISSDGLLEEKDLGIISNVDMDIENYIKVNREYNRLKSINNKIDYDDMQSLLLDYLKNNPKASTLINGFQKSYKHIILDEYQDISPIQIEIMDILMSPEQIRNLVVVGDDDQCQPAETQVMLLDFTTKQIKDLKVGDFVKSYDFEKNDFVDKRVLKTNSHFEEGILEIATENKKTRMTKNHISYASYRSGEETISVLSKEGDSYYHFNYPNNIDTLYYEHPFDKLWILDVENKPFTEFNFEEVSPDKVELMFLSLENDFEKPTVTRENVYEFVSGKPFEIRGLNIIPFIMDVPVFSEEGVVYERVVSKQLNTEHIEVFSIEIEDLKNYFSDEILTHNCIYSFRGSQSEYIIHFLERYKNARRKFISKNYRCKSNILNEVIPMISKNGNRVDKDLCSANEGGVVKYLDMSVKKDSKMFQEILLSEIRQSTDIENDLAILVRFNRSRMLLADKLAEEGIPVDITNKKYLLQNNSVYKNIFGLAEAIINRDPYTLKKYISKCFKTISPKTIESYVRFNDDFVEDILTGKLKVSKVEQELVKRISSSTNAYTILTSTWLLLKDHYVYMIRKKRANKKDVNSTIEYIFELALDSSGAPTVSWKILNDAELFKVAYLSDFIGDSKVLKVYTTHSVKGLEFKKVFVYGLDSDIVSHEDIYKYNKQSKLEDKAVFKTNSTYAKNKVSKSLSGFDVDVEEERRIFYVACTRAIDELYICYNGDSHFALLNEMATYKEIQEQKTLEINNNDTDYDLPF